LNGFTTHEEVIYDQSFYSKVYFIVFPFSLIKYSFLPIEFPMEQSDTPY